MEEIKINKFIKINTVYKDIEKNKVGIIKNSYADKYNIIFSNGEDKVVPKSICSMIDPRKTGDNYDHKICGVCGRYLPTTEFQKNQNGKNGRIIRRPACIHCRENIDGKNISSADRKKWKKVKPSFEVWTCPICKKTTIPNVTSKVVLDHNHKTGIPRGWICDSCNTGLGRFKDNIKILKNAIKYLEEKDI